MRSEANHAIRACVPTTYPPLVTGDPDRPGIDVEILLAVADYIGVELLLSPSDAIGRDFNPLPLGHNPRQVPGARRGSRRFRHSPGRSSIPVRSYAETGWAIVAPAPLEDIDGLTIGALTIISGLDRIGLASYLRRQERHRPRRAETARQLVDGIAGGEFDGGVTEALLAGGLAADNDWWVALSAR